MRIRRHTQRATAAIAAAGLLVGLLGSTSAVLATGTCPGHQTEYVIPSEQRTVDPLSVYDLNQDGIICVAVKGKKTVYGDNRI